MLKRMAHLGDAAPNEKHGDEMAAQGVLWSGAQLKKSVRPQNRNGKRDRGTDVQRLER